MKKPVTFTLPEPMVANLRSQAKRTRRTMTSILEEALENFLIPVYTEKGDTGEQT